MCKFSKYNKLVFLLVLSAATQLILFGCGSNAQDGENSSMKILFLHHSTGKIIWEAGVEGWLKWYNNNNNDEYRIEELAFPSKSPYGWKNYPYDYWNIWVSHAGPEGFMKNPTLEILTGRYRVIIFKHCFPVSNIVPCAGKSSVDSDVKCIDNYKLQYRALREKLLSFPECKFLVWTGAALVRGATDRASAERAREFFGWVRDEWDQPGDNIFIWDFFELETEGGLYLKDEYACSSTDSHPSRKFAERIMLFFCNRLVDVIEGRGDSASVTGQK
jgi:hypothetical protein